MGGLLDKLNKKNSQLKIQIQDEIPPDNENNDDADGPGDEDEILDEVEELEDEDIEGDILDNSKDAEEELDEELSDEGGSETNNSGASSNATTDAGKTPKQILENALEEKMKEYRVFISGELFLAMIDGMMPRFIFFIAKKAKLSQKKSWHEIQLTEKQIELLTPLAEEIVDEIFKSLSPMQQFALALGANYAQNF